MSHIFSNITKLQIRLFYSVVLNSPVHYASCSLTVFGDTGLGSRNSTSANVRGR